MHYVHQDYTPAQIALVISSFAPDVACAGSSQSALADYSAADVEADFGLDEDYYDGQHFCWETDIGVMLGDEESDYRVCNVDLPF